MNFEYSELARKTEKKMKLEEICMEKKLFFKAWLLQRELMLFFSDDDDSNFFLVIK